ncbi:hypothetical protein [Christiangramia sp. SM2212]|uniref:Uncharacterized protein n=1 Tax=Christiangramia sediminicola TaxID=3073267 RepID=A0ABU1EP98_9FLAO|nr:hypothetical protein [Christiangramia sp. SM2212]MDR5590212.1 hypothetical protein [Christiangramia sp. SM2212]
MTRSFFSFLRRYIQKLLIAFFLLISLQSFSQDYPGYDELTVEMNIPQYGVVEIPVAIKGETAYISISDLFDIFQLKNDIDIAEGTAQGYIISPNANYVVDTRNFEITYQGEKTVISEDDFIRTPTSLYLKSDLFEQIFGLNTDFNFRQLAIDFNTDIELPVIKEIKLARARDNAGKYQNNIETDTIVEKNYPLLKGGLIDWGVIGTQQTNGFNDNRLVLGFGGMVAGGETTVRLNYSDRIPFQSRNQFYQWRYVNNNSPVFKQITAGKIFTGATSSLFAPVVGVQFSNSPLTNRRSFGTYVLSDYTEPLWTVELYVNNVLIDYAKADASGFYTFDVPLMYGNTNVDLRFYGPYGEEITESRNINIPYNFVPKNELEYTLSAGVVEDEQNRQFSRFNLNYGLSNSITIGGGVEYLSEVESGEYMPFFNTSIRLLNNLLFTGDYTFGVKGEGLLTYRTPSNLQFNLSYAKYHEEQTAINYNYLEERKFSVSAPLRNRKFNLFTRFSINQIILPSTTFTTSQLLMSGNFFGVSTNLSAYALHNDRQDNPTIYASLGQTYRLPYNIYFSPQIQYDISDESLRNINLEFQKVVFDKGFLNFSFENNFLRDAFVFEVGMRYSFDFAQTGITSRIGNRNSSFIETARGSIRLDDNNGDVMFSNRSALTRGGISLMAFLDFDNNGKKSELEPLVPGLSLESNPGIVTYNDDKTILRISDLQPYVIMKIQVDETSLDNIAWKIEDPVIEVESVANYYKPIHVPVKVLGEVSGFVNLKDKESIRGIGRILVNIKDNQGNVIKSLLTEGDGYFYHLGLSPGIYTAEIDSAQLQNLNFSSSEAIEFEIEISEYGDIVDNIEFTLEKNQ